MILAKHTHYNILFMYPLGIQQISSIYVDIFNKINLIN